MIEIIPAILVANGRCISLRQGDFTRSKIYEHQPLVVAKTAEDHGFRRLHYVDLDGARRGTFVNYQELRMITSYTNLEVDVAGGIRSDGSAHQAFESGAQMLTCTSVAVDDPKLFASWLISFGRQRLILGADCWEGTYVTTTGWQKRTRIDVLDHIARYHERSILYVKCTDLSRDGTLEGPNFDLYRRIRERFPDVRLLANGGVRSLHDVDQLQKIGCRGVIIGKALYEGLIKLSDVEKYMLTHPPS
ncbi:MAG: 1-(5-phosphoribosyl)-5-[(5-phosphoribosylamino)methylideneamino] imidazole-4-carboxamide isomerase [Catalinimonas sp.]